MNALDLTNMMLYFVIFICNFFVISAKPRPMEGVKLRCCTLIQTPLVEENELNLPYHYNGIAISYLSELERKLGFQCGPLIKHQPKDPKSTGFTDFVENMSYCSTRGDTANCHCDIGVAGFRKNDHRFNLVDYVEPFMIDSIKVLTHIENTSAQKSGISVFTAFDASVWGAVTLLFILFAALKLLDKRFPSTLPLPESGSQLSSESTLHKLRYFMLKSTPLYRARKAVQSVLGTVLGMGSSDPSTSSKSTRQWVLNFCIVLSGLFLVLVYEAAMTATLVDESISSTYQSVKDLKSCRISPHKVCLPRGGAIEAYWNKAISSNKCHQGLGANGTPVLYDSYDDGVALTANKTCTYLFALGSVVENAAHGRYCNTLAVVGHAAFPGGLSFILPKGSKYTVHLSKATLQLGQEDKLPSLKSYLMSMGSCANTNGISISFFKLRIFFIVAYATCGLLFLIMMVDPGTEGAGRKETVSNEIGDEDQRSGNGI